MAHQNDDRLLELSQETLHRINTLHQLLQNEAQLLNCGSSESIASLAAEKQETVSAIDKLDKQQNDILHSQNLPGGKEGLIEYVNQFGQKNPQLLELETYWAKISQRLLKCRALNESNGACIALRHHHCGRSLEILQGKSNAALIYGPDGGKQQDAAPRSSLTV